MTALDDTLARPQQRDPPSSERARSWRVKTASWLARQTGRAARGWERARSWRVTMTLPAIYGAGAVSAGVALIVDYAYPGLGWAVFLVCSGGFALIVDHRVP